MIIEYLVSFTEIEINGLHLYSGSMLQWTQESVSETTRRSKHQNQQQS